MVDTKVDAGLGTVVGVSILDCSLPMLVVKGLLLDISLM